MSTDTIMAVLKDYLDAELEFMAKHEQYSTEHYFQHASQLSIKEAMYHKHLHSSRLRKTQALSRAIEVLSGAMIIS